MNPASPDAGRPPDWWTWLSQHQPLLWWLFVASLLSLLLAALLLPWLVTRLPADWLLADAARQPRGLGPGLMWLLRNALGVVLLVAGLAMLVLPGQGLLTILLGLLLADVPGKRRLVRRIAARPAIRAALDRLRARAGKEPFRYDGP